MSSSVCRTRYVSWCVDSPTPVTTEESSHPNPQSAGSPPETCGGQSTFSHQPLGKLSPEGTQTKALVPALPSQSNPHSSAASPNTDTNSHSDKGKDDDSEEGRKSPPEAENRSKKDPSLQHPEAGRFPLPRSCPVVSRHHHPVSWLEGEPDTSGTSSFSPLPASLSEGQCGRPLVSNMEDLGSRSGPGHQSPSLQEEKKQRYISVSSNLNHFLISLFHLPFSGQQGLAEDHKGRHQPGCGDTHTPASQSKQRSYSCIPESSADIFKTSCELEKENTHFIVVDMVLEVLEGVKWTLSADRQTPTVDAHPRMDCNKCTHRYTICADGSPTCEHKQTYKAHRHTQICYTGDAKQERDTQSKHSYCVDTKQHTQDKEDTGRDEAKHQLKTFSVLSSDSGFEDCGGDATLTPKDSLTNAEWLAQQLVLEFKRSWLPSHEPRRGRQSLRSSLQELPGTGGVVMSSGSLTEEIRLRTRMRGSLSWAPPRFQIIFTVQPTLRRSEVVALQHFLCAGCGTKVEPKYIKKLRYCEYLGRYFCVCCHSGSEAVIPARVLSCWDFNRYSVSDFSKQLLDSVWHQPLFDLSCMGKTLCSRVKELDKFRGLQEQLLGIRKLLSTCRFSGRVTTEFEQLPVHLIFERPPLFSMDDLLRVKKGQLVAQAKAVLHAAVSHVENCELCLARGFICEFCRDSDVIFPFQSDVCRRCPVCKACFHKHCFVEKKCPKCARIQSRRKHADVSTRSSSAT